MAENEKNIQEQETKVEVIEEKKGLKALPGKIKSSIQKHPVIANLIGGGIALVTGVIAGIAIEDHLIGEDIIEVYIDDNSTMEEIPETVEPAIETPAES